jgi:hypothetical protein
MDLHPETRRIERAGFRQGDVLFVPVQRPKGGEIETNPVMAFGEATGHHHTLYGRVRMFRDDAMTVATVDGTTPLRHQEHIGFLPKADSYQKIQQVEYDLIEGARAVAD